MQDNRDRLGLKSSHGENDIHGYFNEIIQKAYEKYGNRVVVLVDEYDKPILDNIEHPSVTAEMRDGAKNLYSVIKNQDSLIRFVFMTGVSKFSKVGLFSGINQLKDITLSKKMPQYVVIRKTTWKQCLPGTLKEWIGERLKAGITVIIFWVNRSIIPMISYFFSAKIIVVAIIGLRPEAQVF